MRQTGFWAIALLLLCSACGGGDDDDGGGKTFIEVRNNSALTMDEVRYSTCASAVFGDDILEQAVGPQQAFIFEVDQGGCYDVFVGLEDLDGTESEVTFNGIEVATGATVTVTVVNPD